MKPAGHKEENRVSRAFENAFNRVLNWYTRGLDWSLAHRNTILLVAVGTFVLTAWLFITIPKGFFPVEDIGQISVTIEGPEDASYPTMVKLVSQATEIIQNDPNVDTTTTRARDSNVGNLFIGLKPRSQREPMDKVLRDLRRKVGSIPGVNVYMTPVQNLRLGGRTSKSQFQYVLQSVRADELNDWAEKMQARMRTDGSFIDVTSDSQLKGLQAQVDIDRDRANEFGIGIQDIRTALYSAYGDRQISTIYTSSNSYSVILQDEGVGELDESALARIYLRSKSGTLVLLLSVATVRRTAGPISVNHQGQLQAITISFNLAPGVPLGDATAKIDQIKADMHLPTSIVTSYAGDAAVFQSSQGSQAALIVLALVVIYILLGVLYESYIHPITILAGLPSAAVGALLTLRIFGFELTMIAMIGILLLIGHGEEERDHDDRFRTGGAAQ